MRPKGSGSVIQKGKSYYLRIRVDGKRVDKPIVDPITGEKAQNITRARRIADLMTSSDHVHKSIMQKNELLTDVFDDYLKQRDHEISENTKQSYRYICNAFCRQFTRIKDISHDGIVSWVHHIFATRNSSTAHNYINIITGIFNWLHKNNHIHVNPFNGIRLPKKTQKKFDVYPKKNWKDSLFPWTIACFLL